MNNDVPGVIQFHVKGCEVQEEYRDRFSFVYATINVDDASLTTEVKKNTSNLQWDETLTFEGYIPETFAEHAASVVVKHQQGSVPSESDATIGKGALQLSEKFDPATDMWEAQFIDLNNTDISSTREDGYLMGFVQVSMRTICQSHFEKESNTKKSTNIVGTTQDVKDNSDCCCILL